MWNVRRQDADGIGPDHRNLERHKRVRELVEVTPRPAPRVGQAHIGVVAKAVVGRDISLPIIYNSAVPYGQQPRPTRSIDQLIQKKKYHSVAVKIAGPEIKILAELVFK